MGRSHIYDELFKQDKVRHVLVRHEQAAVHAADGYARSTDKVGVALVTSGPGATNAVTGIATAYGSHPMVVISGRCRPRRSAQDAFQEVDTVGITRPCVKHNFLVRDVRDIASTMKKAFTLPRPVVRAGAGGYPQGHHRPEVRVRIPADGVDALLQPGGQGASGQIKKALQLLLGARRPMVYIGGGVVLGDAADKADALVRKLVSVTNTLMGLGGYPPPTASSWACSACTAPTKPTWRCTTATCCSPSGPLSTTA